MKIPVRDSSEYYLAVFYNKDLNFIIYCDDKGYQYEWKKGDPNLNDILYDMSQNCNIEEFVKFRLMLKLDTDWWCCPDCGWDTSEDDMGINLINEGEKHFNMHVAIEYGGSPYSWNELWKCPQCGCEFEFENSNY